jgi:hypothetical protein
MGRQIIPQRKLRCGLRFPIGVTIVLRQRRFPAASPFTTKRSQGVSPCPAFVRHLDVLVHSRRELSEAKFPRDLEAFGYLRAGRPAGCWLP